MGALSELRLGGNVDHKSQRTDFAFAGYWPVRSCGVSRAVDDFCLFWAWKTRSRPSSAAAGACASSSASRTERAADFLGIMRGDWGTLSMAGDQLVAVRDLPKNLDVSGALNVFR